ncbi:S26 family signal peptidase [Microtetraspora sp. AC03309]|uniref:S26 family signal peptidase n=1 Tax=Microtetraspora sp. AC03309 TaxID=2779376 RepID=UPI001E3C1408|nr:S26 family signal peptidase [Microtetraspora sp. AC03309]
MVKVVAGTLVFLMPAATVSVVLLRRRWLVVAVRGESMLPALHDGDTVLVRRRRANEVSVGDIVVVESPGRDGRWASPPAHRYTPDRHWMVKRVAALGGDRVPDGVPAPSPVVPLGALVVLGDNGGYDSRVFGLLPADRMLGTVARVLAPARPREEPRRGLRR